MSQTKLITNVVEPFSSDSYQSNFILNNSYHQIYQLIFYVAKSRINPEMLNNLNFRKYQSNCTSNVSSSITLPDFFCSNLQYVGNPAKTDLASHNAAISFLFSLTRALMIDTFFV